MAEGTLSATATEGSGEERVERVLSLEPIPADRDFAPSNETRKRIATATDLLRVWIASCEAGDAMTIDEDKVDDMLAHSMYTIAGMLEKEDDNLSYEFFMARATLGTIDTYLSHRIQQDGTVQRVEPRTLATAAAHAYRLLAGLYVAERRAS